MSTQSNDVLFNGPDGVAQRFKWMGDESHAQVVFAVGVDQRGFEAGFMFRAWDEFSIADNTVKVYKIVSTKNVVLTAFEVLLETEAVDVELVTGGTEGGTFSQGVTVQQTNNMSTVPTRTSGITINAGGTHTGGTVSEKFHVDSSKHGLLQLAPGNATYGFSAKTYYIRITQIGNTSALGFLRLLWEERS